MLDEIIDEVKTMSTDISDVTQDICLPESVDISFDDSTPKKEDIFRVESRKAWDKSVEARCDFSFHLRLTRRASTNFISIYQKSVFGRTLTDIKGDDSMISFIANNLVPVIKECIGYSLSSGQWAIVTTPMRRHKSHNFATMISEEIARQLEIPFYFDCAHCRSKQRIGAIFDANNIPIEPNIIVFDDFVTTGSTLLAMKNLLQSLNKNVVFFAAINNKL